MKKLLIISLLLILALPASPHKYYTSITQLEYNSKNHTAEFIVNVFWDDLEKTLSKRFNKQLHIDNKDFETYLKQYLPTVIQLKAKNQVKPINFIGTETKGMTMSVYFEIALPEGLNNAELKQNLLIDDFEGQTNIVNIIVGSTRKTLIFKAGSTLQKIML
ncbi:DUF6702 family protein [Solitalea koreensis]|uniref:DUF3887 domain-containing protein n=1 Tax=Solitalea koreensis TaxID=543615 RepID=A0A521D264_9SPHI|nr:DUF6702 family protein [Solitalea koreensis]SMO65778.1 hypothetical protein SAMN06265350_105170 [Solitalea koreensis]